MHTLSPCPRTQTARAERGNMRVRRERVRQERKTYAVETTATAASTPAAPIGVLSLVLIPGMIALTA